MPPSSNETRRESYRDGHDGVAEAAEATNAGSVTATLMRIQAAVLSHEGFAAAASALANELTSALRVDRVCVGMLDGDTVKIVALSHRGAPEEQASVLRAVSDAMHEAIEQSATIVYPVTGAGQPRITIAHEELERRRGGSYCTVPLAASGRVLGALTLERARREPLLPDEIALCEHFACMVGPILRLHYANERPMHKRLWRTAVEARTRIFAPGRWFAKAALVASVAALVAALFLPIDYWLGATARIEGSVQRVLVAPVDGFIGTVSVRPGDRVVAGQVLAELAEQDLQLERRKWQSELTQHENGRHAAMARGDRAQFAVSDAKAEAARAQLALAEQHLGRARLRAPFDGIVIKGDLTHSVGAPVQRGDVLLTIAPANDFRLIVEVDERDIPDVQTGAAGSLALAALPENARAFRVARITPVATARDGRNFFEVEGTLGALPPSVQPGLQGVAKIQSAPRTLAWIWTHRFTDWLRLTLWAWRT